MDNQFAQIRVPTNKRRSTWSLTVVMLGLTFFSASMWTGGKLGIGLTASQFFFAIIVGNLFLGLYTSALGYIGARTGLSTHLLARYSFGWRGSWLPSFILGLTQVGWFGVGVVMFALPVAKVTGLNVQLLTWIAGLLMSASIYFGISGLTALATLAVPAIAILGSISVGMASSSAGGLHALLQLQPEEALPMSSAITLVIASFISAGTLSADFVRFSKKPILAVLVTMIAFFIGNSMMFIFGAAGAATMGEVDISEVMLRQGLIIPAILVLGFNIWTTNDNALYASGLGFANITRLPANYLSVLNGLLGTASAFWLYNNFISWLNFLSLAIPPIGATILAHYLLYRQCYNNDALMQQRSVNWLAIIVVLMGATAAKFLPGIGPLNAVLTSFFAYIIFDKILIRFRLQKPLEE